MWIENMLQSWDQQNLTRQRKAINHHLAKENIICIHGKEYINFSSNDYLGLMYHSKISSAFSKAAEQYGFGSGSSAMVSGYSEAHSGLEQQFAEWLNVDRAILFNSGYLANLGVFGSLLNRDHIVLSDKLCHASILEGIRLSRAKHYRYQHVNSQHLKTIAEKHTPDLIVTESVFSMEGDIAPIPSMISIAQTYKSKLVIDDAHGIGVLGQNGAGVCEQFNMNQNQFSCVVLPLGKAFNGMGAIVAGKEEVIETILQFSNSYRYTTALPAAVCVALQTSLQVMIEEEWRREQLSEKIKFFTQYADEKKLRFTSNAQTPIKCIVIGDNEKTLRLQNFLLNKGCYLAAIRPPTVPKNTARLRVSINCLHTEEQIRILLDYISEGLNHV